MLQRSTTESVTAPLLKPSAMREPANCGISFKLNRASPHSKYFADASAYLSDSLKSGTSHVHWPSNISRCMKSISSYMTQRPPQLAEVPPRPLFVHSYGP